MIKRFDSIMLAALAVTMLTLSLPLQAAVRAELDRNRITEGETVTLTITTDDARQSLDTDLSALETDFEVLDRRSETQLSIVNGRQTAIVRLVLTLEPRAAGSFQVPPLRFGSDTTSTIAVRVDPAPELEPGSQPPVFIEMEVVPAKGPYYVHAQIGLLVRVFYQQNLTEAAISQPEPSPASVRLMQETPYQAERGGERYRVLERSYAVFPERSGELEIPPMRLTGRLVERRNSSVWQPAVRGRRVQVESEALNLTIEPKPAGFSGSEWQPARDYQLTQQISSGDALRVGEPVTRTVIVDAVGLEENMIAEPAWPELPDTRIYPDQPQGITRDDGEWVLGHKEFRYAVVPEREGELLLPELRVEWWDTQHNRARTAVLEAHKIFVQPSALVPPPPTTATASRVGPEEFMPQAGPTEPAYWRWLAMTFALLWVMTVLLFWQFVMRIQRKTTASARKSRDTQEETGLLSSLRAASLSGDRRAARRSLQSWLREFGPMENNPSLLEFAASLSDPDLSGSIYALDSEGFQPASEGELQPAWDGGEFWRNFDNWRKGNRSSRKDGLPSLSDLYAPENRTAR